MTIKIQSSDKALLPTRQQSSKILKIHRILTSYIYFVTAAFVICSGDSVRIYLFHVRIHLIHVRSNKMYVSRQVGTCWTSYKSTWSNMSSQFLNAQDSLKSTLIFWGQTMKLCGEKIMEGQYIVNSEKHKYSRTLWKVAHSDLHALLVKNLPTSSASFSSSL
jgi:hypothetical protein